MRKAIIPSLTLIRFRIFVQCTFLPSNNPSSVCEIRRMRPRNPLRQTG